MVACDAQVPEYVKIQLSAGTIRENSLNRCAKMGNPDLCRFSEKKNVQWILELKDHPKNQVFRDFLMG